MSWLLWIDTILIVVLLVYVVDTRLMLCDEITKMKLRLGVFRDYLEEMEDNTK